ncbi:hypothetical protein T265_12447 [Opisthorchis viverrini]|uniref:ATPase AAA-type core domain-containing protein n=1 Tax=Opisthorchis viverrini TaxID=6198 RepID=A0A075AJZ0_OPIVI|nr:hypothetical protein T265_12447 [Opisthorchis viverrini]KER34219.1 hypothetical protein T265_12447 [Opisthorchis viverrini]
MTRLSPNLLITGTPGTGKTALATLVSDRLKFNFLSVNDVAKNHQLYDGYDDKNDCHILDEDAIVDNLEGFMARGGQVTCFYFI